MAAISAAQAKEAVRQDAALEEGVELVLDELRQAGARGRFGLGEKGRGVLLHQTRFKDGYAPSALDGWAATAKDWARGKTPQNILQVAPPPSADKSPLPADVFVFFINGAKEQAPAAATALLERL